MKKFNLIERLFMDSHEKQKVHSVRRYAAMLFLLLTCVAHAWAADVKKNAIIYMDNSASSWSYSYIYFVINNTNGYKMKPVDNTKLYVHKRTDNDWTGYSNVRFFATTSSWGDPTASTSSEENMVSYGANLTNTQTNYGFNAEYYVIKLDKAGEKTNSSTWANLSTSWIGNSISSMNKTITYGAKVSTDNGSSHSASTIHGDLSAASNTFSDHETCDTESTSELEDGDESSTTTVDCGYTATTTLTATDKTNYTFEGWYNSSGTRQTTDKTLTLNPTANATYYAYYKLNQYTVSYGVCSTTQNGTISLNSGSGISGSSSSSLNHGTSISFSASPSSGYQVEGWYSDAACSSNKKLQSGGTSYDAGTLTAAITIYVKFEAKTGGIVTLTAGTGGQVSLDNSSYGSSKTKSSITTGDAFNIYAQANTGYSFSSWAKSSGSGTISSTSSASTSFTPVAYEDATVTASFTENSYTITIVGGTAGSTTAKVVTTGSATANPPFGKCFINWTVPESNFSFAGGTSATDATITFNATADGTVTANFGQLYAFIQGRMTIYNAARDSKTHVASSEGGWDDGSTRVPMNYDGTNHEFYLSTHMTPAELATEQSSREQYFFVKTSSSDDDLTDVHIYRPSTAGEDNIYTKLTTAGGKQNISKDPATDAHSYWFDSSDDTGYAKLYFNGTQIWYGLEQTLQYNGNGSDGGSAPASKTYYDKGTVVKAASNTFTRTGYTFNGWNTAPAGGGTSYAANADVTLNSNITLYAQWLENEYNTTVEISPDGSGTTSPSAGTVAIKQVTGTAIEATKGTNTVFEDWSVSGGGLTMVSSSTTNPNTFKATSPGGTITANFTSQWTVAGSMYNTWAWDKTSHLLTDYETISTKTYAYVTISDLDPNTSYTLKVKDRNEDQDHGWYGIPNESEDDIYYADGDTYKDVTNETGNQNIVLHTAAAGDYIFKFNVTDKKLAIEYPTSWWITTGVNDEDGGSFTAVDDASNNVFGGKFVANNATVTFTASNETGYTFDGWYNDGDYADGHKYADNGDDIEISGDDDKVLTLSSIAASKSVYAKFVEKMTTVALTNNGHGHVEIGGATVISTTAGVTTTKTITAVPDAGYYFSGWEIVEGSDFSVAGTGEANATTTLTGGGSGETSGQTLKANFTELDKIYFRNLSTMDDGAWANVYVYLGVTWNGYENAISNANASYKVAMKQVGATDVYWAYVPRAFTSSEGTAIAFSNQSVGTSATINTGYAATRNDYNRALQMYVPSVTWADHGAHYYNNGYWRNYPVKGATGAGYYMQTTRGTNLGEFKGQADNSDKIEYTLRFDGSGDKTVHIKSAGGIYYEPYDYDKKEYPAITSSASTMTMKSGDEDGLTVTMTSEGNYTFVIDQSSDIMVLTVNYPISTGDYRLKHTYNSGAKTTYSDIIKAGNASTSRTLSMFLSTAGTETLVLQKCTAVVAGVPAWDAGDATNLSEVLTTVGTKGDGVYQFDVAVSADKVASAPTATLYDGPYYIKTDCADGDWGNYKRNVLTENTINFDKENVNTFDYYFCKNVGASTNVKFVIANDYNNAVSDTIVEDATYLTTSGGGTSKEYTPEASCIRFSYNSATNEAKRAYLRYSDQANFLNIIPSAASKVYDAASAGNDLYGVSGDASSTNKLGDDDGNFVYRKTVYAVSGATIDIKAEYTTSSKKQTFVSNRTLITSSNKTDRYPIRVVYDFKTNHLTTAWEASGELTAELSGIEFIYVRNGQNQADQVTLGTGGALTGSKVCGVFQFAYNDYVGKVGAWPNQDGQATGYTNEKCMFYFSFPFDVNVSDIFGIGTYGKEWKIQYYDGAERASKGFFRGDGTTTFWKDMPLEGKLNANEGYSLLLDNDYFNTKASGMVFESKSAGGSVYLYFPSTGTISVASGATSIDVPEHECTLPHYWTEGGKTLYHSKTDSHWNMMGVPLFQSQSGDFSGTFKASVDYTAENPFGYLYAWTPSTNSFAIENASSFTFKSMNAYMVQYTGTITFFSGSHVSAIVAARQKKEEHNYTIDLEVLDSDNEQINHTFVELREGALTDFELNEDVYMASNDRDAEIYSYAGDYDVAANVLPIESQTVQLGLNVHKAGTYSITMPSNFSGTVTLVDTYNNTRTNLAIEDYEVNLTKGACNDRFLLEININKAPTAIDGVSGDGSLKDGKAHKFIENGVMYILQNGRIYNAEGALVK